MKTASIIVSLAFIFILIFVNTLFSAPMRISLDEINKKSINIVIACMNNNENLNSFKDEEYTIDVQEVIRGNMPLGNIKVKKSESGHAFIDNNKKMIAFIDSEGRFSWVAQPLKDQELETGILKITGFFDFNAYLVSPSILTLSQLRNYLKTGEIEYKYDGFIHFYNGKMRKPVPSKIKIKGFYKHLQKTSKTNINIPLKGFTNKPKIRISPGYEPHISIEYESNLVRPFIVYGNIIGIDNISNTYKIMFWVYNPHFYHEDKLKTFLSETKYGYTYFDVNIKLKNNKTWKFELGKEIGRIGIIKGNNKIYKISSMTLDNTNSRISSCLTNKELHINLKYKKSDDIQFLTHLGTNGTLIQQLLTEPIKGNLQLKKKNKIIFQSDCVLELNEIKFAKNENYGLK